MFFHMWTPYGTPLLLPEASDLAIGMTILCGSSSCVFMESDTRFFKFFETIGLLTNSAAFVIRKSTFGGLVKYEIAADTNGTLPHKSFNSI